MSDWLILIHQLPPKPDYVRVKISRRLQRIGAVALKNTVYVLPESASTLEDLEWTAREIRQLGGEATVARAVFIEGISAGDLQQRFNAAREEGYAPLIKQARALRRTKATKAAAAAADIRRRADAIRSIDYFDAPGGQALDALLSDLERGEHRKPKESRRTPESLRGRVWVTRAGVHVDRMASAWLIRRFVDPKATFRFVRGTASKPRKNELRFDMFEAEFTHDADRCTFEVMVNHLGLDEPPLRAIAEVVHDIDLHDDKYGRPETSGVAMLIQGITLSHASDDARLRRAAEVFDDLYRNYAKRRR